jgi:hypothetical protein
MMADTAGRVAGNNYHPSDVKPDVKPAFRTGTPERMTGDTPTRAATAYPPAFRAWEGLPTNAARAERATRGDMMIRPVANGFMVMPYEPASATYVPTREVYCFATIDQAACWLMQQVWAPDNSRV